MQDEDKTPKEEQLDAEQASPADVSPEATPEIKAKSQRNWKMIAPIAVVVLLFVGGLGFMLASSDTAEAPTASSEAEQEEQPVRNLASAVSLVEGTVQLSPDGESWKDATGGETVNAGDHVRTLADSRVVLLHDDGSAIRVDENSEISLSVSDSESVEVMLVSGQVYSRVVESESRTYAVVTESERFEALGTAFKTASSASKDEVEVYESSVKVDSDEATVEEGNKYDTESKQVSGIDLEKLQDDEFVQWNKQKDSEDEEFKNKLGVLNKEVKKDTPAEPEQEPEDEPGPNAGIVLSGSATDDGVKLNWQLTDVSSKDGFKIARSKTDSTPSYKEDVANYVSNGNARSKVVDVHDGKAYYFRVCIYRASSGTCDTYSNAVKITAPDKKIEPVVSGVVELTIDGNKISWDITGTAPHGFKVVMNKTGSPVYPTNSIQYVGAGTDNYELPDKPAGTYVVRVCKYTADSDVNNGCTNYSNEVEYVVSGS